MPTTFISETPKNSLFQLVGRYLATARATPQMNSIMKKNSLRSISEKAPIKRQIRDITAIVFPKNTCFSPLVV
ncbi:MAG: hypothetical protein A4E43_01469 [Methanosaeta sp. PtaB.Bin005]|nr:MAG: hypothetical protein A4E43_01469 [Methanosaeta sp. PtaB.Bin005]